MRHRFDLGTVGGLELVVELEDRIEVGEDRARRRRIAVNSGQMRDPEHVVEGKCHEGGGRSTVGPLRRSAKTTGPGVPSGPEFVIKPHQISAKATGNRLS